MKREKVKELASQVLDNVGVILKALPQHEKAQMKLWVWGGIRDKASTREIKQLAEKMIDIARREAIEFDPNKKG